MFGQPDRATGARWLLETLLSWQIVALAILWAAVHFREQLSKIIRDREAVAEGPWGKVKLGAPQPERPIESDESTLASPHTKAGDGLQHQVDQLRTYAAELETQVAGAANLLETEQSQTYLMVFRVSQRLSCPQHQR